MRIYFDDSLRIVWTNGALGTPRLIKVVVLGLLPARA